jgi:tight adherence protein B
MITNIHVIGMSPATITALVFVAVVLAGFTIYSLFRDVSQSDTRRVKKRIEEEFSGAAGTVRLFQNLSEVAPDPFHEEEKQIGWWDSFRLIVEQSGLKASPEQVVMRGSGIGLTLAAVAFVLTRSIWLSLVLFVIGLFGTIAYVIYKRNQRLEKLRAQLADAYAMMGRVMRAGQTSTQAMHLVSQEFSDPIAGEFAFCNEQQDLGLPPDVAFRELARRTGLLEIKMFVVAAMVHREAGGSLAQLLDNLAGVIRARFRVRGEIRTLTAEGRFQAAVLLALPLFLFFAMYLMRPDYGVVLFDYPWLIAAAFVSELIGALWIRRIINFEF